MLDEALRSLPQESSDAHKAFVDYTLMQDRSIRKLHAQYVERAKGGAKPPTVRLPTLEKWSSLFRWQERVRGYEEYQRLERLKKEQAEIQKMRERHIQVASALIGKALEYLKENKLKSGKEAVEALRLAVDIERKARGLPESVIELHTMTDEQLVEQYKRRLEGLLMGDEEEADGEDDVIDGEVL